MNASKVESNVLVRHIPTAPKVVWDLWTTPEGISGWWGPTDSSVTVQSMDVSVGGKLFYELSITGAEHVQQIEEMGMSTVLKGECVYTEVVPERRLAYRHLSNIFPGVEPYWNEIAVDLHESSSGVGMVITWAPLHDEAFTRQLADVWEEELAALMTLAGRR